MKGPEHLLRLAAAVLAERKAKWALVGGWAVSIRAEPRFTRDIDLAVAVADDEEAESIVREFGAKGYRPAAVAEHDAAHRLATARLASRTGDAGVLLDLLFASSGIEPEICAAAEGIEALPNLVVPVARSEHLLALKILARDDRKRPQDAGDIAVLLRGMDEAGLQATCDALRLIQARGYSRGRDLVSLLESARREFL
jgi:predicted nucleotidyltransferase